MFPGEGEEIYKNRKHRNVFPHKYCYFTVKFKTPGKVWNCFNSLLVICVFLGDSVMIIEMYQNNYGCTIGIVGGFSLSSYTV